MNCSQSFISSNDSQQQQQYSLPEQISHLSLSLSLSDTRKISLIDVCCSSTVLVVVVSAAGQILIRISSLLKREKRKIATTSVSSLLFSSLLNIEGKTKKGKETLNITLQGRRRRRVFSSISLWQVNGE